MNNIIQRPLMTTGLQEAVVQQPRHPGLHPHAIERQPHPNPVHHGKLLRQLLLWEDQDVKRESLDSDSD